MLFLYLDPSSGSILLQLLLASLAGIGIAIATSWKKIKILFQKKRHDNILDDDDGEDE